MGLKRAAHASRKKNGSDKNSRGNETETRFQASDREAATRCTVGFLWTILLLTIKVEYVYFYLRLRHFIFIFPLVYRLCLFESLFFNYIVHQINEIIY